MTVSLASAALREKQRKVFALRKQVAELAEEAAWRDFLALHCGKRSMQEITAQEAENLIAALSRAGAPRRPRDDKNIFLIKALWKDLHCLGEVRDPSEAALLAFARQQAGTTAGALGWLTGDQRNRVVDGLKAWLRRAGMKSPTPALRAEVAAKRAAAGVSPPPAGFVEKMLLLEALFLRVAQLGDPALASTPTLAQWLCARHWPEDPALLSDKNVNSAINDLMALNKIQEYKEKSA
jgi:hypothetical protein